MEPVVSVPTPAVPSAMSPQANATAPQWSTP
jgi:hypothetical protein